MKKRLKWIAFAALANVAVLPLTFATPRDAGAVSRESFFYHCCKETVSGDGYCCLYCCLFRFNCFDGMCGDEQ